MSKPRKGFLPKVRLWKLGDNEVKACKEPVSETAEPMSNSQAVEDIWNYLKSNVLQNTPKDISVE